MSLLDLIKQYNKTLKRIARGESFLNNPEVPQGKKDKWRAEFTALAQQMSDQILQINQYEMSTEEIINGFEVKEDANNED